jgi:MinD-like ATPase involved in chromosome partitioning or flagellar assembly
MADDEQSPDDRAERQRASAQDAAADLSRMGIDPSLLGLESAPPPPARRVPEPFGQSRPPGDTEVASGQVLPLRPEFASAPDSAREQSNGPLGNPGIPGPPAAPAAPQGPPNAVEELLGRTGPGIAPPKPTRSWLKALTLGLVTPDAAEAAGNERFLLGAVRTRQSERRVVALHAGKGGVGTTTIALGVGMALAAVRDDHSVLLDVRTGTPSLAALQGQAVAPNGRDLVQAGSELEPRRLAGGLHVVDSVGWGAPLRRAETVPLLERLGRDFAFTLVDVGNDSGQAGGAALARSDQTVIVTSVGHWGLAAAQMASIRLRDIDPYAVQRAVYVVVCTNDKGYRRVHREVMQQLANGPVRVVVVPPDASLRSGTPFDPSAVSTATREAMLEVAAAVAVSGGVR